MVADNPYKDEDIYQLHDDEDMDELENNDVDDDLDDDMDTSKDDADINSSDTEKSVKSSRKKLKWFVYLVILVIVGVAGYTFYQQVLGWFTPEPVAKQQQLPGQKSLPIDQAVKQLPTSVSSKDLKVPTTHPKVLVSNTVQKTDALKETQKIADNSASDHMANAHAEAAKRVEVMNAQMDKLQQENQQLIEGLRRQQFESQMHINALTKQVSSLKGNLNELNGSITQLTDQVKQNQKLQTMVSDYQEQAFQRKQAKVRARKQYFVQAAIPGRAWLKAADGTALTVAVGDDVPGYGVVTAINSLSGTVSTSAGPKIAYGVSNS